MNDNELRQMFSTVSEKLTQIDQHLKELIEIVRQALPGEPTPAGRQPSQKSSPRRHAPSDTPDRS